MQESTNATKPRPVRGRPAGGSRTGSSIAGSPNNAIAGSGVLTEHTDETLALLAGIREGSTGLTGNSDYESRPDSQGRPGTLGASGLSARSDGQNHAASAGDDRSNRSSGPLAQGTGRETGPGNRGSDQGKQQPVRSNSGSASGGSAPKGLVAVPAPKGGKRQQQPAAGAGIAGALPWIQDKPLTPEEAGDLRENLIIGLESLFQGMDELISATNKHRQEAVIWSTIDREDLEFLTDGMLRAGMVSPAAAWAVRGLSNISVQFKLGLMLVPRFIATWRHYAAYGGFSFI